MQNKRSRYSEDNSKINQELNRTNIQNTQYLATRKESNFFKNNSSQNQIESVQIGGDLYLGNLVFLQQIMRERTILSDNQENVQDSVGNVFRPYKSLNKKQSKLERVPSQRPSSAINQKRIISHGNSSLNQQIDSKQGNLKPPLPIKRIINKTQQEEMFDQETTGITIELPIYKAIGNQPQTTQSNRNIVPIQSSKTIVQVRYKKDCFFRQASSSKRQKGVLMKQSLKRNSCRQSFIDTDMNISNTDTLPIITAESWAVFNGVNGEKIYGFNDKLQRQIASITKLMTCWVVMQLSQRLELDMQNTQFFVTKEATSILGTSASLIPGESISIYNLLFALMLPSGNDAALTLAENFSSMLINKNIKDFCGDSIEKRTARFVQEMNRWAAIFKMKDTKFSNPHGLGDHLNLSTATDVGILCTIVTKDLILQEIVKTESYISNSYDRLGNTIWREWTNTNKILIEKGFCGIKTGITTKAGPCLTSQYKDEDKNIIIVLLNSLSSELRWIETQNIIAWILSWEQKT